MLKRHGQPSNQRFTQDDDLKLSDYAVEVDTTKTDMDYQDALTIGMKMEAVALRLYQDLSNKCVDKELKDLFGYLAEEEAKHKHSYEVEFDNLL